MDERCFDKEVEYDYSYARFILARIIDDEKMEFEYKGGSSGVNREVLKEFTGLEAGDYYLFCEVDWLEKVN